MVTNKKEKEERRKNAPSALSFRPYLNKKSKEVFDELRE